MKFKINLNNGNGSRWRSVKFYSDKQFISNGVWLYRAELIANIPFDLENGALQDLTLLLPREDIYKLTDTNLIYSNSNSKDKVRILKADNNELVFVNEEYYKNLMKVFPECVLYGYKNQNCIIINDGEFIGIICPMRFEDKEILSILLGNK